MALAKFRSVPEECAANAVIYARYSSDNQTENSIDFQLRAGYAYGEAKGLKIVGEYIDRAISGTTDNRPDFQRMIKDSKKQQFAFIIVYRFDRFARNRYDSAIYKKELESYGVRVLSTEESIGTGDEGMILESIYEAMAEAYSRRLSRVVKQGMREKALKGLSTGGNLSHGLKVVDDKIVLNERISPAIQYSFEARSQGIAKKAIADELNARGYRTKSGKLFTSDSIAAIITNPAYKGIVIHAGIEIKIPVTVSEELWERANAVEKKEKRLYGKKETTAYYALSGKLFCGHCGATLLGDSGTSKSGKVHFYYTCSKKKKKRSCDKKSEKKDFIEWYVCEQTVENILTDKNIERIADNVVSLSEKELGSSELIKLEKQLSEIERELDAAADALIKTNSTALIKRINDKVEKLEAQQKSVETEISRFRINQKLRLTTDEVEAYLKNLRDGDLFDEDFRRRLINTLINCIYLFDDKVVIYYNINGMSEVSYIDMLSDLDELPTSSECSNSSRVALPKNRQASACRFFTFSLFTLHFSLKTLVDFLASSK